MEVVGTPIKVNAARLRGRAMHRFMVDLSTREPTGPGDLATGPRARLSTLHSQIRSLFGVFLIVIFYFIFMSSFVTRDRLPLAADYRRTNVK